jgi:hypothetical protein
MTARGLRPALLTTWLIAALAGCAGTDSSAGPVEPTTVPATESSSPSPTGATATAPAEHRIDVQVAGGQVTGGTGRVTVPVGERVDLTVTSDGAGEVHVHGYDLTFPLSPGEPGGVSFAATIPGVFEVELHDAGTVLLSLQVQ